MLGEHARKQPVPPPARLRCETGAVEAKVLGLLDRAFQRPAWQYVGQVDQRARGAGDWNAVEHAPVAGSKNTAMGSNSGELASPLRRRGHIDRPRGHTSKAPQRGRAAMARHGSLAAGQDRGHDAAVRGQARVADRVDARMDQVQPTGGDAPGDRATRDTEFLELRARDHTVLARREQGNPPVRRGFGSLSTHTVH